MAILGNSGQSGLWVVKACMFWYNQYLSLSLKDPIHHVRNIKAVPAHCALHKCDIDISLQRLYMSSIITHNAVNSSVYSTTFSSYQQIKHQSSTLYGPLWGKSTSDWWFTPIKGQQCTKHFHAMPSTSVDSPVNISFSMNCIHSASTYKKPMHREWPGISDVL